MDFGLNILLNILHVTYKTFSSHVLYVLHKENLELMTEQRYFLVLKAKNSAIDSLL